MKAVIEVNAYFLIRQLGETSKAVTKGERTSFRQPDRLMEMSQQKWSLWFFGQGHLF